ncbi:class I SAM-dependent methyltransferase [Ligilactobacillus murinus]|uniref:Class I SAM-dependent methyltransferase n=1 Tax=Ligilactobacillus murinus TaxID=1622 RepID=A0AAE6WFF6_9LACO|nr:class I SAM-dependent methyltransferase [Ligilactobacillus murinus]NEF83200.1 class I SAM-dependent methyltransferase [Ligilactobacillus murinus]NEF85359.1 class I SAM-dependent methyltransferase [Ligilactobacillus murinus]NEF87760.1 class I SAM-dependent methyltransferase [Ligilactobacillus murinus]NEF90056.1 class I SAM-dependent methyltransferase [Ligilactobacillus murinus]NEF92327.1 class I SAM-dependent methyltransferase [Ligilactobacillus murinus]
MFIFYIAGKQATDRLLAQGNITQQTKVLEVACNRGTTMLELAQKYDCQVIGIDLDAKVVAKAKENIKRYGLEEKLSVQQGNAFKLPFAAETFDIVINVHVTPLTRRKWEELFKQ